MQTKYYDENRAKNLSAYMWYRLLDKSGKVITNYANAACYGSISGGTIPKNTAVIDVYRERKLIPYNDEAIVRYVYDLNDMGFPVTLVSLPKTETGTIHFHVFLDNYDTKPHLISTLTLLRMMWEAGMAKTLDIYLQLMDKKPDADKLDMIQAAHKTKGSNANGGHSVTYNGNGGNVDRDTLFKRFSKGIKVNANGYLGLTTAWKGADPFPCVPTCGDCMYKRMNGIYP